MKEMVTLNKRDRGRLVVSNQIEKSKMIGKEAAEVSGYKTDRHCSHIRQSRLSYLFILV